MRQLRGLRQVCGWRGWCDGYNYQYSNYNSDKFALSVVNLKEIEIFVKENEYLQEAAEKLISWSNTQ